MIEYIAHEPTVTAKGVTDINVQRPLKPHRAGDLFLVFLHSDHRVIAAPPTGWTEVARLQHGPPPKRQDLVGVICWKLARTNEPSSYRWLLTGRSTIHASAGATFIVFRGAFPGSPIVDAAAPRQSRSKLQSVAPSVEGVKDGALVCFWVCDDPQLPQAPARMTQLSKFSLHGDGHAVAYELLTKGGPTGTRCARLSQSIGGGGGTMGLACVVRPHEWP